MSDRRDALADLGRFRALDVVIRVLADDDAARRIGALLDDLRVPEGSTSTAPAAVFTVTSHGTDTGAVARDGTVLAEGPWGLVEGTIIGELGRLCVDGLGVALHATTVDVDGVGVVLLGPSGFGKSTLAAALLVDGAHLVAEDISALDADGAVRGYHRPLALSPASLALSGAGGVAEVEASSGDVPIVAKGMRRPSSLGAQVRDGARPDLVVLVDHRHDTDEVLTPARGLHRMLEWGVAVLDDFPADLERLCALLCGARIVALGTADLPRARATVRSHAAAARARADDPAPWLIDGGGDDHLVFLGDEAVAVRGDAVHHANPTAAAIALLAGDGMGAEEIASMLDQPVSLVEAAAQDLGVVIGPARPSR